MRLYRLSPEVAGGLGENSILVHNENGIMKDVSYLHYKFEGWLGDELLTTSPCFIVTEKLSNAIINSNLTGCTFQDMEVSKSYNFELLKPGVILPKFKRLIPTGTVQIEDKKVKHWSGHDFCLIGVSRLVVSDNALNLLQNHNISNCDIIKLLYL